MAITRKKVTKEKEDLTVLESAKIKLSEEQGYEGDTITFDIETIPEKYDRKNLVLIPEDDDVIKINYDKKEIFINSDELKDVEINLKDIPTESSYDKVTVTASGLNPEKAKEIKQKETKQEEDKVETKQEETKEEVKNPVLKEKKQSTKTKSNQKVGKKKMTSRKKNVKKFSEKSYTKEELINDLVANLEDNRYSKKELSDIINEIDALRENALVKGKTLTMKNVHFSRKLIKGRIHNAKMETVKQASFVPPHIAMVAKVENEDKEVIKGEEIDKDNFKTDDGKDIKVSDINAKYEEEYKKRFR
ncbi:hypothetical protein UFVDC4_00262 [Staphylococcus phage vB_SauM-UFV_DC4]|nr:hypothetical protein UFVDC4_00262 [Staphylococcus phage vB_SauM-UFV_DC4]